jgi:hypothetical protein
MNAHCSTIRRHVEGAVQDNRAPIPLNLDLASEATGADDVDGLDVTAVAVDGSGADAVDAAAAFVDHVEVRELGTAACPSAFETADTDADTRPDGYLDVTAGSPLCWRLVMKANTTVTPVASDQIFGLTVRVTVDGLAVVDEVPVYVLVPAA